MPMCRAVSAMRAIAMGGGRYFRAFRKPLVRMPPIPAAPEVLYSHSSNCNNAETVRVKCDNKTASVNSPT